MEDDGIIMKNLDFIPRKRGETAKMTETCRNLGLNLEDEAELGRLERLLMDGEKKGQARKWSFSALRLHERLELWLGTNGRGRTEGRLMARSRGLNNGVIFGLSLIHI